MDRGSRQRDDEPGLLTRLQGAAPSLLEGLLNCSEAGELERARAMLLGLVVGALAWARRLAPEDAAARVHGLRAGLSEDQQTWPRLLDWLRPQAIMGEALVPAHAWRAAPEPGWSRALLDLLLPPEASAAAGLEELAHAPCELLGELYEHSLGYRMQREQGRASLQPWPFERKGAGSFYTPALLAESTVRRVLEPLLGEAKGRALGPTGVLQLKICDPAMGGGSFLLASMRALGRALAEARGQMDVDSLTRARAEVLRTCIYGVDRDPLALELGRAALWLEAGAPASGPREACPGLRCGDALVGTWPESGGRYPAAALERPLADRAARKTLRALQRQAQTQILASRPSADLWCALWFWPSEQLDALPLPGQIPAAGKLANTIRAQLVHAQRVFHWHEQFPEVFERGGFDAVVTNPPWDIHKPNSKEFFSRHDPNYRGYSKQLALRVQQELFARDPSIEQRWQAEQQACSDRAHFLRNSFAHQGRADLNAYKLFVELAYRLTRAGGELGLIVPSGLYTDRGSAPLRELLLRCCRWRWLYGFENRRRLFDIDGRFKFCVVIAQKTAELEQAQPDALRAAFMRHSFEDWEGGAEVIEFPTAWIRELSPHSAAIVELRSARELELLRTIHAGSVPLGAEPGVPGSWGIRYARELDMTNDSASFSTRAEAESKGLVADAYGDWHGPGLERHVPVYEGRMIEQFDFSAKGWVRGRGRQARWRELGWADKRIEPQYLVPASVLDRCTRKHGGAPGDTKLCFMAIGSATNRRSMFAALVRGVACGNAVPVLRPRGGLRASLGLAAVLDSFVYDFALRARLGGLNLNYFVISETVLPPVERIPAPLIVAAARLSLAHPRFAPAWLELLEYYPQLELRVPGWALTEHERLRLRCMVDAMVAALYGLSGEQLRFVLRDCDHEVDTLARRSFSARLDPKGMWRVDRARPPQLRHSVLSLHAHDALRQAIADAGHVGAGIEAFAAGLSCEGWQLPDQLCLDALGPMRAHACAPLARPERAVAAALGPRWLDWQLAHTPAQAWARCRAHAAALALSG